MRLTSVKERMEECIRSFFAWIQDFFNITPVNRRKQLIPVETDPKKRSRPQYHDDYDNNLLKMFLVIILSVLLMMLFGKLSFE